jgi:RecB family exonuclease
MSIALSYSALKDYENCPRKFNEVRILKKYRSEKTEAILYGEELHKVAEDYIGKQAPLPTSFGFMRDALDRLKRKPGEKHTEYKMAVTIDRQPCEWTDKQTWLRGIADLLIVDRAQGKALVVDYKTGNDRYADIEQLRLMALMTFAHFPEVQRVKGALLFVLKNRIATFSLERKDESTDKGWFADAITGRIARLNQSILNGEWQPKSSGLCGYCPCDSCEYNSHY